MIAMLFVVFGAGIVAGHLVTVRADRHALVQAHSRGLLEGRDERRWEVNRLQNRVRALEANIWGAPRKNGNGVAS